MGPGSGMFLDGSGSGAECTADVAEGLESFTMLVSWYPPRRLLEVVPRLNALEDSALSSPSCTPDLGLSRGTSLAVRRCVQRLRRRRLLVGRYQL